MNSNAPIFEHFVPFNKVTFCEPRLTKQNRNFSNLIFYEATLRYQPRSFPHRYLDVVFNLKKNYQIYFKKPKVRNMEAAQLASRDHEVVICTRICTMFSRSYKTLQS